VARVALLLGSFLLTFALLSVVAMVSLGQPGATLEPTPSHSPYYTLFATPPPATPTPTPQATVVPTPVPSANPDATPQETPAPPPTPVAPSTTPVPLRTPAPSFAIPTTAGAETQVLVVAGADFVESQVPDGGSITPSEDGIVIQTTENSPDALWVTYRPDLAELPAGAQVLKVDTRVCGQGTGQFWEQYGPVGSNPNEYEVAQPEADGCWHFTDAPADDLSVIASVMLQSSLYVEKVEYTVTFVR
jgi:hypothetical protein